MKISNAAYFFTIAATLCVISSQVSYAQSAYRIDPNSARLILHGTSTLHGWTMTARGFTGDAVLVVDSGTIEQLSSLNVTIPVRSLKGENSEMDENAYTALKATEFSEIAFQLNSANISPHGKDVFAIAAHGNVFVAGVAKFITLDATARLERDSTISITGSTTLKMSDFQIQPPSFMLGAMKTGNEVTLEFVVTLRK